MFIKNNLKIFISAGDISGDIHAGTLAKEFKENSNATIFCIGGTKLKENADTFIEDIVNINAFGFFPLKQVLFLKKVFKKVKKCLIENKIDKVVLVDYYGFNIILAKFAHSLNIPVYYYVSPQIWASRKSRINKIAKYVKIVFPILPFEKAIYDKKNIKAIFEGNPLIDIIPSFKKRDIKEPFTIGLFAGSRKSTIARHIPIIIETAKILKEKINVNFILFSLDKIDYEIPNFIKIANGNNFEERKNIDIALCPSGTVSLENALMGIPMIVMYKLAWANYFIARLLIKVNYITLINILANKPIVPEYIQHNATAQQISNAILNLLKQENYNKTIEELLKFKDSFGKNGVAKRVALKILED